MDEMGKLKEDVLESKDHKNEKVVTGEITNPEKQQGKTVRLSMAVLGIIVGLGVGFWAGDRGAEFIGISAGSLDYSELDEVYSVIKKNYDGEIVTSDLIDGAKKGMVAGLGDPYSQLFTYNETEEFYDNIEGEFNGVGIELINRDGRLMIVDVIKDTPAEKAGLQANDLIYKVDDYETLDWSSEAAVKVIRGDNGSKVKMTIIRNNEQKEFEITRATISNPSVKWEIVDGIGVLEISRFGENDTVKLARQAANEFVKENVKGVVLDLRGNGGGYVDAAVDVASLWMEPGQVVTVEKKGDLVVGEGKSGSINTLHGIKTVVLIDGGSASAAEILAGALQDYGLAEIAGVQSYGKGSVQTLKSLLGGDSLKITIAKWYTPKGQNIDESGITPDMEVKLNTEEYKASGKDNQLEKALEFLK